MTLTYKGQPIVVISHAPDWSGDVSLIVQHKTNIFEALDVSEVERQFKN
jgi:hypothetical protein